VHLSLESDEGKLAAPNAADGVATGSSPAISTGTSSIIGLWTHPIWELSSRENALIGTDHRKVKKAVERVIDKDKR